MLRDVSLVIEPGSKVGIVGASGVGKSTLIDLLHRHWDPDTGEIRLDDVPLPQLSLSQLRRLVAVVSQDIVLFAGTVADNLRYACPDASDSDIASVLQRVHLDNLPQGGATPIGEQGYLLSGGQRQRLAIARALLQQPRVLILDEATSAIDAETEAAVIEEVDRLFGQCTRLVISHRPAPLADADRVFELREGRLLSCPVPLREAEGKP